MALSGEDNFDVEDLIDCMATELDEARVSLGCVFLEYVTWFFHGYNVIDQDFSNARLENDIYDFESDTFFSIRNQQAYIKPAVLAWIEQLQTHPDCSWYLWDLLELIKTNIVVEGMYGDA
ncbi:hypothetical protein C8034_v003137 [Colletotrichum sidae]|uniref:Uncharacterized protein n=1 Tax=Colletotrichum sidae TaxID=1347389 RepID=A0A4R8TAQ3_9PEZI|nr:hypothetical protein C8034_v003137 [Colletotrichum sidae]